ncbi:MAG: hypothetical protein M1365_08500 [Actinobacteria bacterium]|nr:hypothetical protein [Actinomycetota bacterium]
MAFTFALQKADYSAKSIKTRLHDANFYQKVFDEVDKSLKDSADETGNQDPFASILGQFLTKEYLQQKIELFIDDSEIWALGKAKNPPVLSFIDIKQKITQQNPDLIKTLEETSAALAKQQKELAEQNSQNGGNPSDMQQENIDFNKIIKSDFSIPIGQNIIWVKNLSWLVQNILILEFLPVVLLIAMFLLSTNLNSKLKWLSAAFLVSSIVNGFAFLSMNGISKLLLTNLDKILNTLPSFTSPLLETFINPFLASYLYFAKIAIGGSVVMFVLTLIASLFIRQPQVLAKKKV